MSKCVPGLATVCLALGGVCDPDLWDIVNALASINARLYERGLADEPWSLRWEPDGYGTAATMRDARVLLARGVGSCHELAAAYAGWLRANGARDATVVVIDAGRTDAGEDWHVVAEAGGQRYDPQAIGQRHG